MIVGERAVLARDVAGGDLDPQAGQQPGGRDAGDAGEREVDYGLLIVVAASVALVCAAVTHGMLRHRRD